MGCTRSDLRDCPTNWHVPNTSRDISSAVPDIARTSISELAKLPVQRKRQRQEQDKGRPVRGETYAGRLRLRPVQSRNGLTVTAFVAASVAVGSTVATDGWQGYNGLKNLGYAHESVVLGGEPELAKAALPMIHLVFSNLKAWILGTHHGVRDQHLQAYLNE